MQLKSHKYRIQNLFIWFFLLQLWQFLKRFSNDFPSACGNVVKLSALPLRNRILEWQFLKHVGSLGINKDRIYYSKSFTTNDSQKDKNRQQPCLVITWNWLQESNSWPFPRPKDFCVLLTGIVLQLIYLLNVYAALLTIQTCIGSTPGEPAYNL